MSSDETRDCLLQWNREERKGQGTKQRFERTFTFMYLKAREELRSGRTSVCVVSWKLS